MVNDEALERALESGAVAQAALDVFSKEPPPASNPLINRPDVVCTPHLGASTTEAQEGVSLEIASAVVGALRVGASCPGPHLRTRVLRCEGRPSTWSACGGLLLCSGDWGNVMGCMQGHGTSQAIIGLCGWPLGCRMAAHNTRCLCSLLCQMAATALSWPQY